MYVDRAGDARALVEEDRAEVLGVDGHQSVSFRAEPASRSAIRSGIEPGELDHLVARAVARDDRDGLARELEASPRAGARLRRSRARPPAGRRPAPSRPRRSGPTIPVRRAPGSTRSRKRVVLMPPQSTPRPACTSAVSSSCSCGLDHDAQALRLSTAGSTLVERGLQEHAHPPGLVLEVLELGARAARERPRLGVGLGDDRARPRGGRRSLSSCGGPLGGDERRAQQLLGLACSARARARAARPCPRGRRARATRPRSSRRLLEQPVDLGSAVAEEAASEA